MPFVTTPLVRYHPHDPCVCVGPCAGYDTRSNCPPLIVLAVLAQSEPVIQATNPAIGARRIQQLGGAISSALKDAASSRVADIVD